MSRHAVILAGGKGTRLRPYTVVLPKPLMPIGDFPILEVIIRQLSYYGFDHITLAVNHQADIIKAFFGNGEKWNVFIDYSLENEPLGTMGPLTLISDLPDNFLVMNGDILTDLNFMSFHDNHIFNDRLFTICSKAREHRIDYGVLDCGPSNELIGFREKPHIMCDVSMGIYMVNSRILKRIPVANFYGFDNLMIDCLESSTPIHVEPFHGYWLDIGRPDDYVQAIEEFESKKSIFLYD